MDKRKRLQIAAFFFVNQFIKLFLSVVIHKALLFQNAE